MPPVVIDNPILNAPFLEPTRHFRFSDEGITDEIAEGRRESGYFLPIAKRWVKECVTLKPRARMAKRTPRTPKAPTPVEAIKHKDTRKNIPTEELRDFVADEERASKDVLYPRAPSLDPQLVWKGKDFVL